MKVFLSWSGEVSRALAVELRDWLPMVVQQVNPWISGKDIDPGQRWALALSEELATTQFAIICLTADNKQSPWILFEAGAVAGSRNGRVIPLLYELTPSELEGPLAQFQSLALDREGIESLVKTLFASSDSGLEARHQDVVFKVFWPILEERLKPLSRRSAYTPSSISAADLLESLNQGNSINLNLSAENTKSVLDILEAEKNRLSEQLTYLNAQEPILQQVRTPISLVETAIEPTLGRLNQVETTLGRALDTAFNDLDSSQVAYLRRLASQAHISNSDAVSAFTTPTTEVVALEDSGLIESGPQGRITMHPAIADYVTKRYGPA